MPRRAETFGMHAIMLSRSGEYAYLLPAPLITCVSNAAGRPAFRRKMCALKSSGKTPQAGLARLSVA